MHSTFSEVGPRKATITLATSPTGLQLTLDGQPLVAPQSVLVIATPASERPTRPPSG